MKLSKSYLLLLGIALVSLAAGCERKSQAPPAAMAGMAGPMEVGVLTVAPAPVTLTQDLPGRISAFRVAEVRARVNGIVLRRLFTEGSDVKEGQVLYEIDPAPYQAALDSALGTLARAEANAGDGAAEGGALQAMLVAPRRSANRTTTTRWPTSAWYDADVLVRARRRCRRRGSISTTPR